MKAINRIALGWGLLVAMASVEALAQPPPLPEWGKLFNVMRFDTSNFATLRGHPPLSFYGVESVASWQGNAARVAGQSPALLQYRYAEGDGVTNIALSNGSIWFWFRPRWSGTNVAGGSGPGAPARLIEIGNYTQDASHGWWSIYLNAEGDRLYFSGQTNGQGALFLDCPIQWTSNEWVSVILNYTATNSAVFLNGNLAASGSGVAFWPGPNLLTNGFSVGGSLAGNNLAQGDFDLLYLYSKPAPTNNFFSYYTNTLATIQEQEDGSGFFNSSVGLSVDPEWLSGGETMSFNSFSESESNLWLSIGLTTTEAVLTLHNTGPDTNYMFFSRENVAGGLWKLEAEGPGLPETNTVTVRILRGGRTNLFFVAGVGNDSGGDGLPDAYEALVTKTDPFTGDTDNSGMPDGYKDTDGDGWTDAEEFRMGQSPFVGNFPPPALSGIYQLRNSGGYNVVEWNLPAANPTSFTVERKTAATWQLAGTVPGDITTFIDTNLPPNTAAEYRVRANYANGSSGFLSTELAAPGTTEPSYSVPATINTGPGGRLHFIAGQPLDELQGFYIIPEPQQRFLPADRIPTSNTNYLGGYFVATNNLTGLLPIAAITTNGVTLGTSFLPYYGYYRLRIIPLAKDGRHGNMITLNDRYSNPFLDGRQHMLDNLSFVTRSPGAAAQYDFRFSGASPGNTSGGAYGLFPSYGVAGFHWKMYAGQVTGDHYDAFQPFSDSSVLRALCYDPNDFDVYGDPLAAGFATVPLLSTSDYFFDSLYYNSYVQVTSGSTNVPGRMIPRELSPLILYRSAGDGEDLSALGLTWNSDARRWDMASGTRNYYGLPITAVRAVKRNTAPGPLATSYVQPGGSIPAFGTTAEPGSGWFYAEAAQPLFMHAGFYFSSGILTRDGPGSIPPFWSGQSDRTNAYILSHGATARFYVWSRHTLANGYPNNSFYLQQYFDKAHKVDTNGLVTTNETGLLSEHGDFFATEPGRVVLTTKPDLTGGPTAAVSVHVLKLQLDVNHDGSMDGRYAGPDNTTAGRPFIFWVNNDYDRTNRVDGDDFEEDDLHEADRDVKQFVPDHAFRDALFPAISCRRDLEDYARLWTIGISNIASALPENAVIEVAWRSASAGNPTLHLFRAVEPNGGTGYLTDETVALSQAQSVTYIGTVSSNAALPVYTASPFASPPTEKYIFRAASRGSGELVLRIRLGSTVFGETSTFVQAKDIKEMYERHIAGDSPSGGILPLAGPPAAREDLPGGIAAFRYSYSPARDTNTPYILFVHGWNMQSWEKDRFAETAFKRLYWQGYQGRFGSFRWPTDFKFGSKNGGVAAYWDAVGFRRHYDNSEFNGWRSALTLRRLLTRLNNQYPGKVYVFGHSLGNVVVGEALRLAGNNEVANTYLASQAAIPAHIYDGTLAAAGDLLTFQYDHPNLPPLDYGPNTPNIYSNFMAGNFAAVARRVNFYNPNDYAFAPDKWDFNQILKPDQASGFGWAYVFDGAPYDTNQSYTAGAPDDTPPWNHFLKVRNAAADYVFFDIVGNIEHRYEVMSYAAESRSKSLGVLGISTIDGNIDLRTIWPPDPSGNNYAAHKWHSAQFRSTNMRQRTYWQLLLGVDGFNLE